jgi:PhoPQ-activated pathogenicity-related protein
VPNEPVIFTDEDGSAPEDEIIAYTFDKYMENLGELGNRRGRC